MLTGFLSWLQNHVLSAGVVGVVEGVLGILSVGGLLSGLLGSPMIKAAAVVAVLLGVLGLFILLVAARVGGTSGYGAGPASPAALLR